MFAIYKTAGLKVTNLLCCYCEVN